MNKNILTVEIPIRLYHAPWVEKSYAWFHNPIADVSAGSGDEKKEIGYIGGGLGGGVLIHDYETHTDWRITCEELWAAFQEALAAHEFDESQTDLRDTDEPMV
jgi:hypothetical protein